MSVQALNAPDIELFGDIVVMAGQIVGEGINRSVINHNPKSHGEFKATRNGAYSGGS